MKKAKPITDAEVAIFLDEFRARPQREQEASPVYQELILFPGWGMLGAESPGPMNPDIPDPRKPPLERAREMKERGQITDTGKGKVNQGSMTTANTQPQVSPWADTREPSPGPAFLGIQTDIAPPFAGEWTRLPEGWFRKE
jgi:hypothetical protein